MEEPTLEMKGLVKHMKDYKKSWKIDMELKRIN